MAIRTPQLQAHFGYRKFKQPPYRFLFLKYDYFLQDFLISELERQGHQAVSLSLPKNIPVEEALRTLLEKAVEIRPDAVVSINAMGLDNQGRSVAILSDLSVPVVIWYLDNHLFNGPYFPDQPPELAIAFTYERALEHGLKKIGFQHVYYLPLATDLSLTRIKPDNRFANLVDKISFVGGTFTQAVNDYFQPEYEDIYLEWQPDFGIRKQAHGRIDLGELFAPYRDRFTTPIDFYRFMAYVVARETRRYRIGRLSCLQDEPLSIFGPDEWKQHLPDLDIRPAVAYETETPQVYRHSGVNLSLTTLQQETALNQRYYDVPLCGGFLLGEWQEALAEHFEPDQEIVYFQTDEELRDKAAYYLRHPAERQPIIEQARKRVLKEHLMEHRLDTMLETLRKVCHDS
ncbi:MAG: glycosyltransferase [Fidelibacterota bacterium]|nr:MAG: glycosyltransferase [Candidatus Neomarinimicrobiota bacterium]